MVNVSSREKGRAIARLSISVQISVVVTAAVAVPVTVTDLDPVAMLLDLDPMAMAMAVMTAAITIATIEAITNTERDMAVPMAGFGRSGCSTQSERQRASRGNSDERFLQHVASFHI